MGKRSVHFLVHGLPHDAEFGTTWSGRWEPRTDIYLLQDTIYIAVEVPGLDEKNLQLHYDLGQLTIEGRRDRLSIPGQAHCLQVEIEHGPFRRTVALPKDADGENIQATYQAGLLLITVPRRQPSAPVNVRVNIE